MSQQRIARITEIAAKAAKLSGGAQVSQDAGLYQFSQGIGSGTLAGDELKSIRENTLRLAKAIADGLDVPIGKLKELGKQGRSEEHTSELQSLMRSSYAVFCVKKKNNMTIHYKLDDLHPSSYKYSETKQ